MAALLSSIPFSDTMHTFFLVVVVLGISTCIGIMHAVNPKTTVHDNTSNGGFQVCHHLLWTQAALSSIMVLKMSLFLYSGSLMEETTIPSVGPTLWTTTSQINEATLVLSYNAGQTTEVAATNCIGTAMFNYSEGRGRLVLYTIAL